MLLTGFVYSARAIILFLGLRLTNACRSTTWTLMTAFDFVADVGFDVMFSLSVSIRTSMITLVYSTCQPPNGPEG
jgi:hypothetical protein